MILQSSHAWCGYGLRSHITQKTGIILSAVGILGAFGGDILVDVLATTYGIYLLHNNKLFLHHMWDNIFGTYQYYDSALLPLYAILVVALIFIVGMVVDYMRLAFIEKPIMNRITLYIESSQSWMEKKGSF